MRRTPRRALPSAGPAAARMSPPTDKATSPAESMVLPARRRLRHDAHQIQDALVRRHELERTLELVAVVADDQHLGVRDDLGGAAAHQPIEVWDLLLDVLLVRTDELGERHVRVVDADVVALPEQGFDDLDERALAQVVGAALE